MPAPCAMPAQDGRMFAMKESLQNEMRRFTEMGHTDPAKKEFIYKSGEKLVSLARNGELSKLRTLTSSLDEEDVLFYFIIKALMGALFNTHLAVASYIIDNGYNLNAEDGTPNMLIECLKSLDDYQCVPVINLLVSKGQDINRQEPKTWLSPLHYAVCRALVESVEVLLVLGADPNSVAAGDVMPLGLASELPQDCKHKTSIIRRLIQSGASESWRRDSGSNGGIGGSFAASGASLSTTQASVRSGGAADGGNSVQLQTTAASFAEGATFIAAQQSLPAPPSHFALLQQQPQRNLVRFNGGGGRSGGEATPSPQQPHQQAQQAQQVQQVQKVAQPTMVRFNGGVSGSTSAAVTSTPSNCNVTPAAAATARTRSSGGAIDGDAQSSTDTSAPQGSTSTTAGIDFEIIGEETSGAYSLEMADGAQIFSTGAA